MEFFFFFRVLEFKKKKGNFSERAERDTKRSKDPNRVDRELGQGGQGVGAYGPFSATAAAEGGTKTGG